MVAVFLFRVACIIEHNVTTAAIVIANIFFFTGEAVEADSNLTVTLSLLLVSYLVA